MAIYHQFTGKTLATQLAGEWQSKHYSSYRNEGTDYLTYKNNDVYEQEFYECTIFDPTYYENGVLLSLKENQKNFPKSKFFVFLNNEGEVILSTNNFKFIFHKDTHIREYLEPTTDIDIEVYPEYIYVKNTSLQNGEILEEYVVNILTGEKIEGLNNAQSLDFESIL